MAPLSGRRTVEAVHASGPAPEVRGYHSMSLLEGPAGGGARAVVLGGRNDHGLIADREVVAVCDLQALRWVPPARCVSGVAPSSRSSHKCAPQPRASQLVACAAEAAQAWQALQGS